MARERCGRLDGLRVIEKRTIKMSETYEDQHRDSEFIFNAVSKAARTLEEAKQFWAIYAVDLTFSRSGCAHAIKRLEKHFEGK